MLGEPVRGAVPPPGFDALPGIDRARRIAHGSIPRPPLSRLIGYRVTQVGAGSATLTVRVSPWLQTADGTVDVTILTEEAAAVAALTAISAGTLVRTAALSLHYLRPCTVESESLVARARVLNSSRRFVFTDALVEDSLGRSVAHATVTLLITQAPTDQEPGVPDLPKATEPAWPTPDPPERPVSGEESMRSWDDMSALSLTRAFVAGDLPAPPLWQLLGWRPVTTDPGAFSATLRSSEWHCSRDRNIAAGVLAAVANQAALGAVALLGEPGQWVGVVDQNVSLLCLVPADGREVTVHGTVTHRHEELFVSTVEVVDGATRVAMGSATALFLPRRRKAVAAHERIVATVVFTDIVGSTRHAEALGDDRWRDLLGQHDALVRRLVRAYRGREVKSTGDGFLVTFETPTSAVQAGRAIRDGVSRLGLEVRVGIHVGECELVGADVAGVAVHVAARIQAGAAPGQILASNTVREMLSGGDVRFSAQGVRQLRGLDGSWPLFSVED